MLYSTIPDLVAGPEVRAGSGPVGRLSSTTLPLAPRCTTLEYIAYVSRTPVTQQVIDLLKSVNLEAVIVTDPLCNVAEFERRSSIQYSNEDDVID